MNPSPLPGSALPPETSVALNEAFRPGLSCSFSIETELLSDSAANLLQINGRLPDERERMLAQIDEYLSMEPRERIEYSLRSRLSSFAGQYGGLSQEVAEAVHPVLKGGRLDLSSASDRELKDMTAFVKSRLMP